MIRSVKSVAESGRTVMVVVHQPSIDIFYSFDYLMLFAKCALRCQLDTQPHQRCSPRASSAVLAAANSTAALSLSLWLHHCCLGEEGLDVGWVDVRRPCQCDHAYTPGSTSVRMSLFG